MGIHPLAQTVRTASGRHTPTLRRFRPVDPPSAEVAQLASDLSLYLGRRPDLLRIATLLRARGWTQL